MLHVQPIQSYDLSESQIYEDLSEIIKAFKTLLSQMENIAAFCYRGQPCTDSTEDLKATLKNMTGIVKHYSYSISTDSAHKNTFHRFICRLIESLSAYKLKFQVTQFYSFLSSPLLQIQAAILSYQQQKNLGMVIKKIQIILLRFCNKSNKKWEGLNKKPEQESKKPEAKVSKQTYQTVQQYEGNSKGQLFTLTVNQIKPNRRIIESKSENSLNKYIFMLNHLLYRMMVLLNKRYKVMSCLDIEYHPFKQTFFQSRDSKSELYEDCFQRNTSIQKEILRYSKQFTEYLQRRQLKIVRKNKMMVMDSLQQSAKKKTSSKKEELTSLNFTKKKISNDTRKQIKSQAMKNISNNKSKNVSGKAANEDNDGSLKMMPPTFGSALKNKEKTTISVDEQFPASQKKSLLNPANITTYNFPVPCKDINYYRHAQSDPSSNSNLLGTSSMMFDERNKPSILPLKLNPGIFDPQKNISEHIEASYYDEEIMQLSKRKKNLQLKKIDIALSSFNGFNETPKKKDPSLRLPSAEQSKKSVLSQKIDSKISTMYQKGGFIQQKRQQNSKLNQILPKRDTVQELYEGQIYEGVESSMSIRAETPSTPKTNSRKYMIKTSNKRSVQKNERNKSLNVNTTGATNGPKPLTSNPSAIKNFRRLKMDQIEKIERLCEMKEANSSFIELQHGEKVVSRSGEKEKMLSLHVESVNSQFDHVVQTPTD